MKSNILTIVLCLFIFASQAQEESSEYEDKIERLEMLLSYSYANPEQKTWYINRFDYDKEEQVVRFKSASSKNPLKVLGKRYTERIFRFQDLNPYNITRETIDENRGLIVKGDLIRLETVKHEKLIGKTINGSKGTPQSYIHFSIPQYISDTSSSFSEEVEGLLRDLIEYSTNLQNSFDVDQNEKSVFETLVGEHVSGNTKRFTEQQSEHLLSFEEYVERKKVLEGLFGYDPVKGRYYEVLIGTTGEMNTKYYRIDMEDPGLVLNGIGDNAEDKIELVNKSLIKYTSSGRILEYRPSGSF